MDELKGKKLEATSRSTCQRPRKSGRGLLTWYSNLPALLPPAILRPHSSTPASASMRSQISDIGQARFCASCQTRRICISVGVSRHTITYGETLATSRVPVTKPGFPRAGSLLRLLNASRRRRAIRRAAFGFRVRMYARISTRSNNAAD